MDQFEYEGTINVRPAWGLIELAGDERLDAALAASFVIDDGAPWRAKVRITVELLNEPEQLGFAGVVPCVPDGSR